MLFVKLKVVIRAEVPLALILPMQLQWLILSQTFSTISATTTTNTVTVFYYYCCKILLLLHLSLSCYKLSPGRNDTSSTSASTSDILSVVTGRRLTKKLDSMAFQRLMEWRTVLLALPWQQWTFVKAGTQRCLPAQAAHSPACPGCSPLVWKSTQKKKKKMLRNLFDSQCHGDSAFSHEFNSFIAMVLIKNDQ